jgi:hypothetical protein
MQKPWAVIATVLAIGVGWWNASLAQEISPDNTRWLLTSPLRQYLSGTGETVLLLRHGFLPRPSAPASKVQLNLFIQGTGVSANDPTVDSGATRTQSETSAAVFGQNVVVGWNDSGEFSSSGNFTGYGYSTDGGATFTDAGPLAGPPGGNSFGDPILAADHQGNFYFATLAANANGDSIIGVAKSTDGGITFAPQVEASVGASNPNDFQDKENMAIDTHAGSPFRGNIYVCWTGFFATGGNRILFSRSTNGGVSFSSFIPISDAGAPVQGCAIDIGPNGEVYVAWEDFRNPQAIRISKSTDGGVSFGADGVDNTVVAPVDSIGSLTFCGFSGGFRLALQGGGGLRTNDFPSLATNPTNNDVYAVFNSDPVGTDGADIFFTRSTDGGATWSTPLQLNDDATTNDQWFPWIAVQPDGTIGVMWYDRRLDPANLDIDVFMTTSTDGGVSFAANTRVTDVSFPVPRVNPNFDPLIANCYMGDYNWIEADAGRFLLAWGDNRDEFSMRRNPLCRFNFFRRFCFSPDPNIFFGQGP